jgi:hypothetical protein
MLLRVVGLAVTTQSRWVMLMALFCNSRVGNLDKRFLRGDMIRTYVSVKPHGPKP